MDRRGMGGVIAGIQTLFSVGTTAALSDGRLLERFLSENEEAAQAAFACLVERHGPMVMRVCKGVLHDAHAAEDAFQVTFLILARKARSIRKRDSIASWLFGVARRVARKAKAQNTRRAILETERAAQEPSAVANAQFGFHDEIHQEVDRLPDRYRSAVVLCYFEGLTKEQAATRLAVPAETIKTRLARARERLRRRLVERGLAPEAFTAYTTDLVFVSLPRSVVEKTAFAAFQAWAGRSAGLSASATVLFEGMRKAMWIAQLQTMAMASVVVASALVATALPALAPVEADAPQQPQAAAQKSAPRPAPASRVLDASNTLTLKKGGLDRTIRLPGALSAAEMVGLIPRHAGILKEIMVVVGQRVRKGETVAVVEDEDLVLAVERSEALLHQAKVHVVKVQADEAVARAAVQAAKAGHTATLSANQRLEASVQFRTKQVDRVLQLHRGGQVQVSDLDGAQDRLDSARAGLESNRSKLVETQAEIEEAEARVQSARAAVDEARGEVRLAEINLRKARVDLESMTLKAPFDGVVDRRVGDPGAFIAAAGTPSAQPLLTIVRTDLMRLEVDLPEQDAANLKVGDPATIRFVGRPDAFTAKIRWIPESVGFVNQEVQVALEVANPDGRLRAGQVGKAELVVHGPSDFLTIPRSALLAQTSPNIPNVGVAVLPSPAALGLPIDPLDPLHPNEFVRDSNTGASLRLIAPPAPIEPDKFVAWEASCFRVVDGRASLTRIKYFPLDEERLRVVEGLKEGDVVVVAPPPGLKDGQRFEQKPAR